jgi:hypothetical protein
MDAAQPELPLFDWQPAEKRARVFTIPPTAPFLDSLARAVLTGDLPAGRVRLRSSTLPPMRSTCRTAPPAARWPAYS